MLGTYGQLVKFILKCLLIPNILIRNATTVFQRTSGFGSQSEVLRTITTGSFNNFGT